MLQLHVAKGCQVTAETLAGLLKKLNVPITYGPGKKPKAHLCWGYAPEKLSEPTLNAKLNRTKLTELLTLAGAGVLTVPVVGQGKPGALPMKYPVLARNAQHHGGKDIMLCKTRERAISAIRRGRAYFTEFVPSSTEYRAWIYRRRHLGLYEKVLTYPKKQFTKRGGKKVGRNYHNGWTFQLVASDRVPRGAVEQAVKAVEALGLDFGAVDVLHGLDNKFYVLEVNSAPGVEGEGRQVIQALAQKIAKWYAKGCPKRKGEKDE